MNEGVVAYRPPQDNPKTLNTQLYIQLYEKKLKRFEQFAKLYPECYWVFVGDNGQAGLPSGHQDYVPIDAHPLHHAKPSMEPICTVLNAEICAVADVW